MNETEKDKKEIINPYRIQLKDYIKTVWYNSIRIIHNPGESKIIKELTFDVHEVMSTLGLTIYEFSSYYNLIYEAYIGVGKKDLDMYSRRKLILNNKDIDNVFLIITDNIVNKRIR